MSEQNNAIEIRTLTNIVNELKEKSLCVAKLRVELEEAINELSALDNEFTNMVDNIKTNTKTVLINE